MQTAESVGQFALVSTIMPHGNRQSADNFRWSMIISGILVLAFALSGILPAAIIAAAVAVPVAYLLYLYDVNLWEDAPLPVVLVLFLFTGVLSVIVSLIFFHLVFEAQFTSLLAGTSRGTVGLSFGSLLLFAVILPVIALAAMTVGPILLARRPAFDDMIDGFTFGVASGTAYAAFETVIAFAALFTSAQLHTTDNLASWAVIILNLMIVKSVVYGSAAGISSAAFSGRGEGYDGFKPAYYQNTVLSAAALIAYWLGVRVLAFAPFGQALGLLWGFVVAGALIIRVRVMLQAALLEVAVEDAVNDHRSAAATTDGGYCPECESQLLPDSLFCIVCGSSLRATSSSARHHIREASTGGAS